MNYKETLFFIGKCLTISHEEHNKKIVEQEIKSNNVNWDKVVQVSTAHYVFPALYCNLKQAKLLAFLPDELVAYMQHITDLNRERNQQIIVQAKEVNAILLASNIKPIFLKGSAFLLQGLYNDIAERMVGDIDFIVAQKDFKKAVAVLKKATYSEVHQVAYSYPSFKHFPRMQKENNVAAIEVHKELLLEKYAGEFNYTHVAKNTLESNNCCVMSYKNQLALSIIASQINDRGNSQKTISLRNAYDVFILSKKTDSLKAIKNYTLLFNPLNNFLASCAPVFNFSTSIHYQKTTESTKYLAFFNTLLINDSFRKKHHKKTSFVLFLKTRFEIIAKAFYKKEYRIWLLKRLTDKQWYQEKMIQLGLKSTR